jgi:integrase
MARPRSKRRQAHGSAWHWKQTDTWYYTPTGTRKRVPLFDEAGERIRGRDNKEAARKALARVKLADELSPRAQPTSGEWTVARVCDVYLVDLHRTANAEWATQVERWLNDLCRYCGALTVGEFKKKHLRTWLQRHPTWSDNTQRNVIGSVLAAFNFCCRFDDLDANPVAGYQKPSATVRVTAFTPDEEKAMYKTTDAEFGQFIRACILTGARPYSELAKITAGHVVETEQGMYYLLKARNSDGGHGHKTAKKTGKDRRIFLCPDMEKLTRKLIRSAPLGSGIPLFRSTRGRAWTRVNCVQRFCELRKKLNLPKDRCMYTCRHTFAKRTLAGYYTGQPVPIEVLAGLMGNTPKVCWEHYARWADQYIDPLWAALGKSPKKGRKAG